MSDKSRRVFSAQKPLNVRTYRNENAKQGGWIRSEFAKQRGKYDDPLYRKVRHAVLCQNPLCEICEDRPATDTHHIDPDGDFFDSQNLAPLCEDCHKLVESAMKRGIPITEMFYKRFNNVRD